MKRRNAKKKHARNWFNVKKEGTNRLGESPARGSYLVKLCTQMITTINRIELNATCSPNQDWSLPSANRWPGRKIQSNFDQYDM